MKTYEGRCAASVPDTLDLAERARLAVNALTSITDPEHNYESYQCANFNVHPPYMNHMWAGPCIPKPIEALPLLRIASGSRHNIEVDQEMLNGVIRDIDEDGLWWQNMAGRPWRSETFKEDQVWPVAHARLMLSFMARYKYDGDSKWLEIVQKMADGLATIAIHHDGRAFFGGSIFTRSTGWPTSLDNPDGTVSRFTRGPSGSWLCDREPPAISKYDIGVPLRALSHWYALSGDKKALDLAERLVGFMVKPTMWGSSEGPTMVDGAEHARWEGHFHEHTMGMMGLVEYAIAVNDVRCLRFVRDCYEYARTFGIARIGFFPAVVGPRESTKQLNIHDKSHEQERPQVSEGCVIADMIWIALRLTDAGAGDYWEDIDQYVRNGLVEYQLLRRDILETISSSGPEHNIDPKVMTDDNVIERNIGTFLSGGDPTILMAVWTACCAGNCSVALADAWEAILRCTDNVVQVNLLLNRASPCMDVDSYLPYEGKVVLKNKTAKRTNLRIPLWVDKRNVTCKVNDKDLPLVWLNNYLVVDGIKPNDAVSVEFPVQETIEKHTEPTYDTTYTCRFKGNTLIDISPRAETPAWATVAQDDGVIAPVTGGYPIYQREHYRMNKAPLKEGVR